MSPEFEEKGEAMMYQFLESFGFDMEDENLVDTPKRIAKMYGEIFSGEGKEPDIGMTSFSDKDYRDLVICKDIPMYSMCSHHFVPFIGTCHVAYIPNGRVVGLSKIPRVVDHYAHRAQIQERLVAQIADFLFEKLAPIGLLVTIQAEHLCVAMRGVKKPGTKMITTAIRGEIDKQEVFETLRTWNQ